MKPVWIVDDDRSIRWVLEKALERDGIPYESFVSAQRSSAGDRDGRSLRARFGHQDAGRVGPRAPRKGEGAFSAASRDHHDRVFGSRQRRRRIPGRSVRISAQAVRRRSCRGADSPRDGGIVGADAGRDGSPARPPKCWARRRRCRKSFARSDDCRSPVPPCSSPASRAPARSWSRARCTGTARARRVRSSRSTRRRFRRTCSSRSSSVTSAARSPARRARAAGASSRPKAARCSWTRSATCRPTCRCACCACSPTASITASAAMRRRSRMSA